jgi:hypothetical protein
MTPERSLAKVPFAPRFALRQIDANSKSSLRRSRFLLVAAGVIGHAVRSRRTDA